MYYCLYFCSHWTRREESDFYRIISTFGVEFDLFTGRYKWDRFRTLARLEKKHDDTLTEYFQAFYHMCMRVCKKFKNDDDGKICLHPYKMILSQNCMC